MTESSMPSENRELDYVSWLAATQVDHPRLALGIGDDMAVLHAGQDRILLSSDMILDGVHFDTNKHSLRDIGRKAVACNLSDCAAMAVEPIAITVSVALPHLADQAYAQELTTGIRDMAEAFDLAIAGGDTTSWQHPLAIDVTIVATPLPDLTPITRAGAKPGDHIYVTGSLGGSLLGKHLTFTPRVKEAVALSRRLRHRLHAMMDITDGLALDLWRLCRASNVGAMLDEKAVGMLISDDARTIADQDGQSPLAHALHDGEDFELLVITDGDVEESPVPMTAVGTITNRDLCMRQPDGTVVALVPKGYVH